MTFSDTEMMELGIKHPTNIHNTRPLIRTLKYALDIFQTVEVFTVEEYKHTHTHGNINNDFAQPHENFRMQFRVQCGSNYNAFHFKGAIIYQRSHNLPINHDSPSHYLPGNFDWGVIINLYTGLPYYASFY